MITTVFLSGSRKISRLNDAIRSRLKKMIDQGFRIVVGDANGADKALQGYLAAALYDSVVVFCAGDVCRNNLGAWDTKNIDVDPKLKGRDFYAQKDKAMVPEADYGFVLWDGKSSGSINNVIELMKNGKPVVVYFGPDKSFYKLKDASDVRGLLQRCDINDYRSMNDKIHFDRRLKDLHSSAQGILSL
jgi:hypothetical protein